MFKYNPIPARTWSRVQNVCPDESIDRINNNAYDAQMNLKGNILQYKKNSSNLTKNQRYAQIAKGQWANRTKSFASQTQTYTNPNTTGLQRVNYSSIPFPNQIVGSPNNPSGPFQPGVPNPFGCLTDVLQDGGSLVGNTYVEPCSGQIIKKTSAVTCNLTTACDVPGPIEKLCWDPRLNTWYPRQNLTMNNSVNYISYKDLVSAVTPPAPTELTIDLSYRCPIVINWTYTDCVPSTKFRVYLNNVFMQTVSALTAKLYDLLAGVQYSVTVTTVVANNESDPSEPLLVFGPTPAAPTNLFFDDTNKCNLLLFWSYNNCPPVSGFNVYISGIFDQQVTTPYMIITGMDEGNTRVYTVTSISNGLESELSAPLLVVGPAPDAPVLAEITEVCPVTLNWTYDDCFLVDSFNIYVDGSFNTTVTTNTAEITVPVFGYHEFKITSVRLGIESAFSNTRSCTVICPPTGLTSSIVDLTTARLTWDLPIGTISGFKIYNGGVYVTDVSAITNTYDIPNLSLDTNYTFGVSTFYEADETTKSTTVVNISEKFVLSNGSNIFQREILSEPGSFYIILENTGADSIPFGTVGQYGTVTLELIGSIPLNVNMLIVGGGGGGACGNTASSGGNSGGGGGGGGGITYYPNITIPLNTPVDIKVGYAGLGSQITNGGVDGSKGADGGISSVTILGTTYTSGFGGSGFGLDSGNPLYNGSGGGDGGSSTDSIYGYGGGAGGGAKSNMISATIGGAGGTGTITNGSNGMPSNNGIAVGGNGGNSGYTTLVLPTTVLQTTLYLSGGGGGGGGSISTNNVGAGGSAGAGFGGSGGGAVIGSNTLGNGKNAINGIIAFSSTSGTRLEGYYGNGGGGGAVSTGNVSAIGGNGSKGVVIFWYTL